jgi:hypothetical protein
MWFSSALGFHVKYWCIVYVILLGALKSLESPTLFCDTEIIHYIYLIPLMYA